MRAYLVDAALRGEYVPFSARYGLRKHRLGEDVTASRHGEVIDHGVIGQQCEPDDSLLRCICPGATKRRCCQRATGEDIACDACRLWCDHLLPEVGIVHQIMQAASL